MNCGDAQLFKSVYDVDGGHHGGVWGWLVSVGFDFHTTSDSGEGLSAGKIGNVNEGVVPCGEDVADGEDISWGVLWAEGLSLLNLLFAFFFGAFLFAFSLLWLFWFSDFSH